MHNRVEMSYGLLLAGTAQDLATLRALRQEAAPLWDAPWRCFASRSGPRFVLASAGLTPEHGESLARAGCAIVSLRESDEGLVASLAGEDLPERFAAPREAPRLLEALRPSAIAGIPAASLACFLVPTDAPSARALLARLLALGRDDAQLSEWQDSTRRFLAIQLQRPPLYLLMRSREEPSEEIRAYVRDENSPLWVEWGYTHPLAESAREFLSASKASAFVDADGRWRFAPAQAPSGNLYDALAPELHAERVDLVAAEGRTKFAIPLRLGPGPDSEPELWLLTPDEFLALEVLIETTSPDELAALTVARLTGSTGTRYLLREMQRPGQAKLGVRVSDIVGKRGFSRAVGTDNLYLPTARRLVPAVRRDDLRGMLGLDQARAVILDEDRDGHRVITLQDFSEEPLRIWIEYVAADRRLALDRLAEEAVFSFSPFDMERPAQEPLREKAREVAPPPPKPREEAPRPKPRPEPARPRQEAPAAVTDRIDRDDAARLREEIRAREQKALLGGASDPVLWRELSELKQLTGDLDDACACLEAALFFGPPDAHGATQLAAMRARLLGAKQTQEELLDLSLKSALTPSEASYLCAQLLAKARSGEALWEEVAQAAIKRLTEEKLPASCRLQWATLLAYYGRSDDRLGLTRAKEKVLGSLHQEGLSEAFDLASFLRFALALDANATALSASREEQRVAIDLLWDRARSLYVQEFDVLSAYLRLLFATGYVRLGASAKARDLLDPIEGEAPVHDAPNRALFRLYTAHLTVKASSEDPTAWQREVDTVLAPLLYDAPGKSAVEWLRKQSLWLRGDAAPETNAWQAVHVEKLLARAEGNLRELPQTLRDVFGARGVYDFQTAAAIERAVQMALKSGNDDLLADVVGVAASGVGSIGILGHRVQALGACIRGAATLGDDSLVDQFLDRVIDVARARNVPSVRELLSAARPAVLALRRLGATQAATQFLGALELAAQKSTEGPQLLAALAGGLMQLQQPRAQELLDRAAQDTLQKNLSYEERFKTALAVLEVLPYWSVNERQRRCLEFIDHLDRFRDTFTVSRFYPTYKVLLVERMIDTISDEATLRTEKLKTFLEQEEQVIRRTIIADWNRACGR